MTDVTASGSLSAPGSGSPPTPPAPARTGGGASLVATGILLSRVLGILREALKARYLGATFVADAFTAAFRIPNLLQNLFGEGALSASFIPVYANMLARGDREAAGRLAGAVAAIMAVLVAVAVAVGIAAAPLLVSVINPGFTGERRDLTIFLVRILFPGAGLLVLSAWCLGVLNSHRKFLLSYTAPVAWNLTIIAALLWFGPRQPLGRIVETLAWASVAGSALQFLVQLPAVLRLVPSLRLALDTTAEGVRQVLRNFVPVFFSRGVVQISAFIDQLIASLLPVGAMALLGYAQSVAILPVSLFGMAVSAAELPEMSSATGTLDERARHLRDRLYGGLRQIAYFVIPSAAAFILFGQVIAAALFQWGRFGPLATVYIWAILAASAIGLLGSTLARLYSSAYFALNDTRTPLLFAIVRVVTTVALGVVFAFPLPRLLGINPLWGTAGLMLGGSVAAWVELALLRSRLNRRIGVTGLALGYTGRLLMVAAGAGVAASVVQLVLPPTHRVATAAVILGVYGLVYVGGTLAFRVPEAQAVGRRVSRLLGR